MNYTEFKKKTISFLKKEGKGNFEVIERTIDKNNCKKDGIMLVDAKKDAGIYPTVYIDDLYEYVVQKELNFEEAMLNFINSYMNAYIAVKDKATDDIFKNYQEKVECKIINKKTNIDLLKKRPFRSLGDDLALIYDIVLEKNIDNVASTPVTYKTLEYLGCTEDEIHKLAMKNIKSDNILICDFNNVYQGESLFGDMYMVTTIDHHNGTNVILNDEAADILSDIFDNQYVLIPMSIHEWLAIPHNLYLENKYELLELIKSVNDNVLEKTEVLSNGIFSYDKQTKTFKNLV